jgi:hypothetical protein
MVFSAQSVPMATNATMEYVMPSLSNNCTKTEEWCFLLDPCRDVSWTSQLSVSWGERERMRDGLSHVEAGSNTSTVALRVVGGDEKWTRCLRV